MDFEVAVRTSYVGVLGQRGFFDRFFVMIDRINLRFGIVSQEDADRAFPPPPVPPSDTPSDVRMPFTNPPLRRRAEDFTDSS